MNGPLLTPDDFQAARRRIAGRVHRTPMLSATTLGDELGVRLHFKAELFQKTGSFKIRGVLNTLDQLDEAARSRGLVSMSAGNHAAALAYGARSVNAHATIVMPARALQSKIDATRAYGGEIELTERDLMEVTRELETARGLTLVHPFDDLRIMAGHGTIGLEILEDVPEVETVIVPIGGGGLIGGIAAAIKQHRKDVRIIGVEPEAADAMTRALDQGRPVSIGHPQTVADGLAAPFAGEHNLRHAHRFVDDVVRVSDEAIVRALRLIVTRSKLAAEPSGAAPLAALVEGRPALPRNHSVVCVISGGNADLGILRKIL
jgi:threonine dehydratase